MNLHEIIFLISVKTMLLSAAALIAWFFLTLCRCRSPKIHRSTWWIVLLLGIFGWGITVDVPVPREHVDLSVSSDTLVGLLSANGEAGELTAEHSGTGVKAVTHVPSPRFGFASVLSLLFVVWLAGFLLILSIRGVSYFLLLKKLSEAVPAQGEHRDEWERILAERQLTVKHLPLYICDSFGPGLSWRRGGPLVVVPTELWEEATAEIREGILRHELAHYSNRDLIRTGVARFFVAVHWFNPIAWFALQKLDEASEWISDLAAFGHQSDGTVRFAESLLAVHETSRSVLLRSYGFSSGRISRRAEQLFDSMTRKNESTFKRMGISLVLTMLLFLGLCQFKFVPMENQSSAAPLAVAEAPEAIPSQTTVPENTSGTPRIHVLGNVVDAATGKPIPRFQTSEWYSYLEEDKVFPSLNTKESTGGSFQWEIEPPGDGVTNILLRVEAPGYEPMMSGPIPLDGDRARLEFSLKKATYREDENHSAPPNERNDPGRSKTYFATRTAP